MIVFGVALLFVYPLMRAVFGSAITPPPFARRTDAARRLPTGGVTARHLPSARKRKFVEVRLQADADKRFYRLPMANRLEDPRTYITPSERAGVAITVSPTELVDKCTNVGPAWTTSISPSSFDR